MHGKSELKGHKDENPVAKEGGAERLNAPVLGGMSEVWNYP